MLAIASVFTIWDCDPQAEDFTSLTNTVWISIELKDFHTNNFKHLMMWWLVLLELANAIRREMYVASYTRVVEAALNKFNRMTSFFHFVQCLKVNCKCNDDYKRYFKHERKAYNIVKKNSTLK